MPLSREQLVDMVAKLTSAQYSEEEGDRIVGVIRENVPHPHVVDVLFWNKKVPYPTPEEMVDELLSYQGADKKH